MSSISTSIPTLRIDGNELQNLVRFIYKHERQLKEFGAIKIQPNIDCKLALKKRTKNILFRPNTDQIARLSEDELIYSVQKSDQSDGSRIQQNSSVTDERHFWSSLPCFGNKRRQMYTSVITDRTFFCQNTARTHFDIHRLPNQSILKLGGTKLTRSILPCVRRAHGPGAFSPLTSARRNLFSIDYHHEGGAHHWYVIPASEREALRRIFGHHNVSLCLDHGQLLIDPSVLDKNHIRYNRIIQHPNEFIVLSAGTLTQSFAEDASWSESIVFALPSWIEEDHATTSVALCQCDIPQSLLLDTMDMTLFKRDLIQKYISSHLDWSRSNNSLALEGP